MVILFSTLPAGLKTRPSRSPWDSFGKLPKAFCVPLALALLASAAPRRSTETRTQKHQAPLDLGEVLARMDETSRRLRTLSADLEYTKVTVVVDDRSTERGQIFYLKGKLPEVLIDFKTPDPKTILIKKNKAEIYLPKINQIQEYNLEKHSELVQQFLLLELAVLFEVVFLDLIDLWQIDLRLVLLDQDRLRVRCLEVDQHLRKFPLQVEDLAPFRRPIVHHHGDFGIFEVGRQSPQTPRGFVHPRQNLTQVQWRLVFLGSRLRRAPRRSRSEQGQGERDTKRLGQFAERVPRRAGRPGLQTCRKSRKQNDHFQF